MASASTYINKIISVFHSNALLMFGIHTVRNIVIFLVITGGALVLHEIVVFLEETNKPKFITLSLTIAENGALIIDVIWFLGDLGIRALRLLTALWRKPAETDL